MSILKLLLSNPLTRELSVDAPETTELRRRIIREKGFLQRLYLDWYYMIARKLPAGSGTILELGSGAGFLKDVIPEVISTDVYPWTGIDKVFSATEIWPFGSFSVRAVVMLDVLHHISRPRILFSEAGRVVREAGRIIMIEPWNTAWSRIIYKKFHTEPFDPESPGWEFSESGPLSGANGALPWIMFGRDRKSFEIEFPMWKIHEIKVMMPFTYLLSGGVSMRSLLPGWAYPPCRAIERMFELRSSRFGMFALIILERKGTAKH
jgi:SAM-dependent methyltransferase